jgi:hypothetical protein
MIFFTYCYSMVGQMCFVCFYVISVHYKLVSSMEEDRSRPQRPNSWSKSRQKLTVNSWGIIYLHFFYNSYRLLVLLIRSIQLLVLCIYRKKRKNQ